MVDLLDPWDAVSCSLVKSHATSAEKLVTSLPVVPLTMDSKHLGSDSGVAVL